MPELPEVETVRRGLAPTLVGKRIAKAKIKRADLRFPFPTRFAARLKGRRVDALERRAKYLLAHLDDGMVWITHLGMTGRWSVIGAKQQPGDFYYSEPPDPTHTHVIIDMESGKRLEFNDPRRVAGLGNIYVVEALYRAGIAPTKEAGRISTQRLEKLFHAIRAVLEEAIEAGGSTLSDYAAVDGAQGGFQHRFRVYDREGEECPTPNCGGTIRRITQAGRSTFYCGRCQR